ncbi:hypothetical protein [Halorussus sp. AFM4]|uniref:hypothetical protein n=1 Tax=Halorussus sp. AFM4 TaxID=3421651 RepID=UPI003EBC65CC
MSPSRLFIEQGTGELDATRVLAEAIPIAKLVGLFVAVAFVPFAFSIVFAGNSAMRLLFTVLAQFVLAVGAGTVLLYVITRAVRLADE